MYTAMLSYMIINVLIMGMRTGPTNETLSLDVGMSKRLVSPSTSFLVSSTITSKIETKKNNKTRIVLVESRYDFKTTTAKPGFTSSHTTTLDTTFLTDMTKANTATTIQEPLRTSLYLSNTLTKLDVSFSTHSIRIKGSIMIISSKKEIKSTNHFNILNNTKTELLTLPSSKKSYEGKTIDAYSTILAKSSSSSFLKMSINRSKDVSSTSHIELNSSQSGKTGFTSDILYSISSALSVVTQTTGGMEINSSTVYIQQVGSTSNISRLIPSLNTRKLQSSLTRTRVISQTPRTAFVNLTTISNTPSLNKSTTMMKDLKITKIPEIKTTKTFSVLTLSVSSTVTGIKATKHVINSVVASSMSSKLKVNETLTWFSESVLSSDIQLNATQIIVTSGSSRVNWSDQILPSTQSVTVRNIESLGVSHRLSSRWRSETELPSITVSQFQSKSKKYTTTYPRASISSSKKTSLTNSSSLTGNESSLMTSIESHIAHSLNLTQQTASKFILAPSSTVQFSHIDKTSQLSHIEKTSQLSPIYKTSQLSHTDKTLHKTAYIQTYILTDTQTQNLPTTISTFHSTRQHIQSSMESQQKSYITYTLPHFSTQPNKNKTSFTSHAFTRSFSYSTPTTFTEKVVSSSLDVGKMPSLSPSKSMTSTRHGRQSTVAPPTTYAPILQSLLTSSKDSSLRIVIPNPFEVNTWNKFVVYVILSDRGTNSLGTWYSIFIAKEQNDRYPAIEQTPDQEVFNPKRFKRSTRIFDIELGMDPSCRNNAKTICNGPLKAESNYRIQLEVFYKNGSRSQTPTSTVYTTKVKEPVIIAESGPSSLIIIILIILLIFCIFLTIIISIIVCRRKRSRSQSQDKDMGVSLVSGTYQKNGNGRLKKKFTGPDILMERRKSLKGMTRPISIRDFKAWVERSSSDSDFRFAEEFESIRDVGKFERHEIADMPENRGKNRYVNVLSYDYTRVKLASIDDEPGSDYINANYIHGYKQPRAYIATQGPLPSTTDDFWRMVWEQKTRNIVMVTQCVERGRVKCHQYWPDNEPTRYGEIVVSLVNETVYSEWIEREFSMEFEGEIRPLRHYQFIAWPDHGVPKSSKEMLQFILTVRYHQKPEDGPLICHCSAGVGRTGSYLCVDILMNKLQSENNVDVYGVVCLMRTQRCSMVQTEDQYIFIHRVILDYLKQRDEKQQIFSGYSTLEMRKKSKNENTEPAMEALLKEEMEDKDDDSTTNDFLNEIDCELESNGIYTPSDVSV